jgi:hypothetical protein
VYKRPVNERCHGAPDAESILRDCRRPKHKTPWRENHLERGGASRWFFKTLKSRYIPGAFRCLGMCPSPGGEALWKHKAEVVETETS